MKGYKKIKNYFIIKFIIAKIIKIIPKKLYLKFRIRLKTGKKIDLKNPKTFSDKINYLKIYPDNKLIYDYADKIKVKDLVSKYVKTPITLWSGNKITDEIVDSLPSKFVIKTNASSGDVSIVEKKTLGDIKKINRTYKRINKVDYYSFNLETSYKKIERKIFIEEYLAGAEKIDYKFFCFNGEVKFCHVVLDRNTNLKDIMVDKDFNNLGFNLDTRSFHPNTKINKPENFSEMIEVANEISKIFKFVRVDLYNHEGEIYLGECTFYPWGGMYKVLPKEMDDYYEDLLGKWLKLD